MTDEEMIERTAKLAEVFDIQELRQVVDMALDGLRWRKTATLAIQIEPNGTFKYMWQMAATDDEAEAANNVQRKAAERDADDAQMRALETMCRYVCEPASSLRKFISLERSQQGETPGNYYLVTFAYRDRVYKRVIRLGKDMSIGGPLDLSGYYAHIMFPNTAEETAAAPTYEDYIAQQSGKGDGAK